MKCYLTVKEAAEYLGLTESALRTMVARRQVPFHKLGRRLRFDIHDLDALLVYYPSVETALRDIE